MKQEPIEPRNFTPFEIRVFVALLGICAVCIVACYLNEIAALWGLLGVEWIVRALEE